MGAQNMSDEKKFGNSDNALHTNMASETSEVKT